LASELRLAKANPRPCSSAICLSTAKSQNPLSHSRPGEKANAEQIEQNLCFKEKRTMANDNTVTFDGIVFQIPKKSAHRSYANKRINDISSWTVR
jgi:hypothetical protein